MSEPTGAMLNLMKEFAQFIGAQSNGKAGGQVCGTEGYILRFNGYSLSAVNDAFWAALDQHSEMLAMLKQLRHLDMHPAVSKELKALITKAETTDADTGSS